MVPRYIILIKFSKMKFYYQSKFLIIPTKILMDQEKLNFWSSWTTFWQSAEYWHVTLVPNNLSKWLFKKILWGKRFYHDSPCSKWLSSVLVQCSYPSTILFPWSIMMFLGSDGGSGKGRGGKREREGGLLFIEFQGYILFMKLIKKLTKSLLFLI